MILNGSYVLNSTVYGLETRISYDRSDSITATFTTVIDGTVHTFNNLDIGVYSDSTYDTRVTYYGDIQIQAVTASIHYGYCNFYPEYSARVITFTKPVEINESQHSLFCIAFTEIFTPLTADTFADAINVAEVVNNIIDETVNLAYDKFNSLKPTMTQLLNSSDGTGEISASSFNNYDLIFIRGNSYKGWTPLCYVLPNKRVMEAVGSSGSYKFQTADNGKFTAYTVTKGSITRSAVSSSSNPGSLFQAYGLIIPTVG